MTFAWIFGNTDACSSNVKPDFSRFLDYNLLPCQSFLLFKRAQAPGTGISMSLRSVGILSLKVDAAG